MASALHDHETKIVEFLEKYWRKNHNAPTYDDICRAVGLSSKDHISRDLDKLVAKGYITRGANRARSIRLIKTLDGKRFYHEERRPSPLRAVPLLGPIAAGAPIPWPDEMAVAFHDEDISAYGYGDFEPSDYDVVNIANAWAKPKQVFALRVKGHSMIDAMIDDGDIVVLEPADQVDYDGEIVAVWLIDEEETTLKRFYDEGARIRLQPCNPTLDPIYVDRENVRIEGKLVSVIRSVK